MSNAQDDANDNALRSSIRTKHPYENGLFFVPLANRFSKGAIGLGSLPPFPLIPRAFLRSDHGRVFLLFSK